MTKKQLENKLVPLGFRLVHYDPAKPKYRAAEDSAGADQSANDPAELVRRCRGWKEQRAVTSPSARRVTAGLASVGPRDEPDPDQVAA